MLKNKIIKEIKRCGPMPIDQFMARALFDAEEGYYTTKHVFGRKGDFITSPEICQIFGEMIGVLVAGTMATWREKLDDKKVQLVEMGPGRGTLMHDMLRTMQFMPAHARPGTVKMIETSPNLRDQQQHILTPFRPPENSGYIEWIESFAELPEKPSIIIANEFFDALPIRQAVFHDGAWRERVVGVQDGNLVWADADTILPHLDAKDVQEGAIAEWSDESVNIMQACSQHLAKHGGMAIIIDYGYTEHAFGDTLQAVKKHAYTNVLEDVGEVDITAHVNFASLKDIALAQGLKVHTLTTQSRFLKALGAEIRLSTLCQTAEPGQVIDLIKGLDRLISSSQMGSLFKVLVVASKDCPMIQNWA